MVKRKQGFFESHAHMDEFLELLRNQYSIHTVYRWVGEGIPHRKISGKLWFPKDEAIQWLIDKGKKTNDKKRKRKEE